MAAVGGPAQWPVGSAPKRASSFSMTSMRRLATAAASGQIGEVSAPLRSSDSGRAAAGSLPNPDEAASRARGPSSSR